MERPRLMAAKTILYRTASFFNLLHLVYSFTPFILVFTLHSRTFTVFATLTTREFYSPCAYNAILLGAFEL